MGPIRLWTLLGLGSKGNLVFDYVVCNVRISHNDSMQGAQKSHNVAVFLCAVGVSGFCLYHNPPIDTEHLGILFAMVTDEQLDRTSDNIIQVTRHKT